MAFDGLGEDLQRAALAPEGWPDLLHRISRETGALGAILISDVHRIPVPPISPDLERLMGRYFGEGWNDRDIRFRGLAIAIRDGAVTDGDIFSADELDASAYYQELLRPESCKWFCSVPFQVAGGLWFLTVQRTIRQGHFERDEVARLKALRRPLEAAGSLSHALAFARVSGMADAFDRIARPALVLDERGLLVNWNTGAEGVLAPLAALRHGEIAFHEGANRRAFDGALAEAGSSAQWSGRPRPRTALRDAAGRSWTVEATALGDWARYSFTQASYLVFLDEIKAQSSAAALWRVRYGLTAAEARVAGALVEGLSVRALAERHGVTYETARTQLKIVMSKTGVHRQSELVRLLLRGGTDG